MDAQAKVDTGAGTPDEWTAQLAFYLAQELARLHQMFDQQVRAKQRYLLCVGGLTLLVLVVLAVVGGGHPADVTPGWAAKTPIAPLVQK